MTPPVLPHQRGRPGFSAELRGYRAGTGHGPAPLSDRESGAGLYRHLMIEYTIATARVAQHASTSPHQIRPVTAVPPGSGY